MSESSNSSSVSEAPEFSSVRFSNPTWSVAVNGSPVSDAILEKVEVGFGSDFSTASFTLPRSPETMGNPVEGDSVDVIANGELIFRGKIRVKTDIWDRSGLKISYTATSDIITFNAGTIIDGAFNDENSDYPNLIFTALGLFNVLGIGASGVPNIYPGSVNVTDQSKLTAAESILSKIGNYKLYYDMPTGQLYVYQLGTGGINTRSFITGKNVLRYNINKSTENVVDSVIVVGPRAQSTVRQPVNNAVIGSDSSGRRLVTFTLSGLNVRDIQVEGLTREKPEIEFDAHTLVNRAMFVSTSGEISFIPTFDDDSTVQNDDFRPRPIILSQTSNTPEWQSVGVEIEYVNKNLAHVFVSEVPKIWYANTITGEVPNSSIGLGDDGNSTVTILDDYVYTVGSLRATYTVDGSKPTSTVGSGTIVRSITDSQYQITVNSVTGVNNTAFILGLMAVRAQAEYARTHLPQISGTITVKGDETIGLRHTILLDEDLLDVLHITHDFTSGFTTSVSLTNERLRTNAIPPFIRGSQRTGDTERERRSRFRIEEVKADVFRNRNAQSGSDKKKDQEPPVTGPYAVYHP